MLSVLGLRADSQPESGRPIFCVVKLFFICRNSSFNIELTPVGTWLLWPNWDGVTICRHMEEIKYSPSSSPPGGVALSERELCVCHWDASVFDRSVRLLSKRRFTNATEFGQSGPKCFTYPVATMLEWIEG